MTGRIDISPKMSWMCYTYTPVYLRTRLKGLPFSTTQHESPRVLYSLTTRRIESMRWIFKKILSRGAMYPSTVSNESVASPSSPVGAVFELQGDTGVPEDAAVFRDIDLHCRYTHFEINITDIGSSLPLRIMGSSEPELMNVTRTARGKQGDDCVICLESMVAGDEVTDFLPCKHTHHMHCAVKWFNVQMKDGGSGRCPQCNTDIIIQRVL